MRKILGLSAITMFLIFGQIARVAAQAPRWLQRSGLEWVFRLASEPRRLAGRYLKTVPAFLYLSLLAALGLRRFSLDDNAADLQ